VETILTLTLNANHKPLPVFTIIPTPLWSVVVIFGSVEVRVRINLGTHTEPLPIHCGLDQHQSVCKSVPNSMITNVSSVSPLVVHANGSAHVRAQHMSVRCCVSVKSAQCGAGLLVINTKDTN